MKSKFLFIVLFFTASSVFANQESTYDDLSTFDDGSITCQYGWYGPGPVYSNYEVRHFSASRSYTSSGGSYAIERAFSEAQDEARTRCESFKLSRGNGSCGFLSCN